MASNIEAALDRLMRLIPKSELRRNTRLKKRIAQVRKTLLLLKEMNRPGSLRRATKTVSRARMKGSRSKQECSFSDEV